MQLIDNAGAGVYADLHFYYRLDLVELIQKLHDGTMTPALILALIERLPQGSATQAMLATADSDVDWRDLLGWTTTDQVLSDVYNAVNTNANLTRFGGKPFKFEPYPTPAQALQKHKKKKDQTLDGLYALFGGMVVDEGS